MNDLLEKEALEREEYFKAHPELKDILIRMEAVIERYNDINDTHCKIFYLDGLVLEMSDGYDEADYSFELKKENGNIMMKTYNEHFNIIVGGKDDWFNITKFYHYMR